jgi:hypothetical protein
MYAPPRTTAKGGRGMCNYNCGTCAYREDGFCANEIAQDVECRWDEEPQHLHPCEHGKPVVASAIAGVEFEVNRFGELIAWHRCGSGEQIYSMHTDEGWSKWGSPWGWKGCPHCLQLLPTADQLPAMYDQWKKEQEGKGE